MRLIVAPPSTQHAALHHLELSRIRGCALGERLWRLPHADAQRIEGAASVDDCLLPVRRARSFEDLLRGLSEESIPGNAPWTLRYANHGSSRSGPEEARAQALLCAIARFLPGPPALLEGVPASDKARELVLLRSRRLWYLAESEHRRCDRWREIWSARPYTFSAATDVALAHLALSLALQAHTASADGGVEAGVEASAEASVRAGVEAGCTPSPSAAAFSVLDPCCGSGTNLFAAARRGLPSVGLDANPLAIAGSAANLAHASSQLAWTKSLTPRLRTHDVSSDAPLPLPEEGSMPPIGLVVANFPWGREVRLHDAHQIRDMLASLARCVPAGTTFALLTRASIRPTLQEVGLTALEEAPVGTRCVLSLARLAHGSHGGRPLLSSQSARAMHRAARDGGADVHAVSLSGPLELLHGGGLRGATARHDASAAPTVGDSIEVQARTSQGRVWLLARVHTVHPEAEPPPKDQHDSTEGRDAPEAAQGQADMAARRGGWLCSLEWAAPGLEARLPTEVELARHGGPNWRFVP